MKSVISRLCKLNPVFTSAFNNNGPEHFALRRSRVQNKLLWVSGILCYFFSGRPNKLTSPSRHRYGKYQYNTNYIMRSILT